MKKWEYINPHTHEPFEVEADARVPETLVRQYAKQHAPPPRRSPLDLMPVVQMPTPVDYLDTGLFSNPKGFVGPGLLANLGSMIQQQVPALRAGQDAETPQQAYDRSIPATETAFDIFGQMGLPAGHFLTRLLTGAVVPAARELLKGENPVEQALYGGGGQLLSEAALGLLKAKRLGSLASTVRAAHTKEVADQAATAARDAARDAARVPFEANRHQQLVAMLKQEHADQTATIDKQYVTDLKARDDLMAGSIMDEAKKSVPAWKDIPSTVDGLYTAVLGKGKELLSDAFQAALDFAKGTATNKPVNIPLQDAKKLGLNKLPVIESPTTWPASSRARADMTTARQAGELPDLLIPVDAAALIEKLPGLKDTALKARAHQALFDANLGIDAAAMAEYKVGKGTIEMVDQNKLFKLDPVSNVPTVDSNALATNIMTRAHMDTVQNRGMGNWDTYPALQAAKTPVPPPVYPPPPVLPEPPMKRPPLTQEPLISPDESKAITEIELPGSPYARGAVTGGLGTVLGSLFGSHAGGPVGAGAGGLGLGSLLYGLGAATPKKIVTDAPMPTVFGGYPMERVLHELLPGLVAASARGALTPSPASATGLDPDALAAMDAEIAAAAQEPDPRLQLDVAPAE